MSSRKSLISGVIGSLILIGAGVFPQQARATIIADLASDWSDTSNPNNSNPNGTWQYRQGTTDLPLTSWDAAGTLESLGPSQSAWAPSNNEGDFLPAMFKSTFAVDANWQVGNVIMHTVDGANGDPSLGVGNYLFTSAVSGSFDIVGDVWDANQFYGTTRPQDWDVLVDGVSVASGSMSGLVNQSDPNTFNITNVAFAPGTTVELELFEDLTSPFGFFVGSNLTIEGPTSAIPEPSTWAMLLVGFAVLGFVGYRKAKGGQAAHVAA